jgi:predicted component of type VI protein secretion system
LKPVGGDQELQWTAACYVLGELSAEERTRFEARLLEDQSAREAVADAVVLLQAASRPQPSTITFHRKYLVSAISSIVAICLLVGVAVYFTPPVTPTADATLVQAKTAALDDDWILELPELLEAQVVVDFDDEETADSLIPAAAEETDGDIPGWLILATSKEGMP